MKRWVYNLIIGVLACIFVVSAGFLIHYLIESRNNQALYNDLAALVQQGQIATRGEDDRDTAEFSPYVEVTDPDTGEIRSVLRQYADIYALNSDLVGWITIAGTDINYPVMQTPDRTDYYLDRDFQRESSRHGCIYAREVCDIDRPSDNITIYGHYMRDGSMFADLMEYKSRSFFESHQTIQFDTLTEQHTYQIISVLLTTASVGEGFKYHMFVDAESQAQFDEFVATAKSLALYDTGVTAEYGDKLITLSTCEYSQTNGRLVVVAKRIS